MIIIPLICTAARHARCAQATGVAQGARGRRRGLPRVTARQPNARGRREPEHRALVALVVPRVHRSAHAVLDHGEVTEGAPDAVPEGLRQLRVQSSNEPLDTDVEMAELQLVSAP